MFYVNYFTSLIYHGCPYISINVNLFSQYRQNENPFFTKGLSFYCIASKFSNSVSFSSNTWQASSIGFALVISTPAAFKTSIG